MWAYGIPYPGIVTCNKLSCRMLEAQVSVLINAGVLHVLRTSGVGLISNKVLNLCLESHLYYRRVLSCETGLLYDGRMTT